MAKQTFSVGQVLTANQMTSLQQTAMGGGSATAKTSSYTLVAADAGTVVAVNSTSATTITVNTGLFAAGDTVTIQNLNTGVSTITAGTATVNTSSSLALAQYEGGQLYFVSASSAIFFKSDGASAGGGKVLQVVMGTTTTPTTIASTSFTDTTLSASITPSSATSKVLIMFTQAIRTERDAGAYSQGAGIQIVRNSTAVFTPADSFRAASSTDWSNSESGKLGVIASGSYLDSPATTSAITYKTQARAGFTTFNGQIKVNESGNTSSIILMEIGA